MDAAIAAHHGDVAHIQIADAPGRGEPGSGTLQLDRYLSELQTLGYAGWVGCEYRPAGKTLDGLTWWDAWRPDAT